jgi:hypothetical protein
MTDISPAAVGSIRPKWRKSVAQMAVGALVGGAVTYALLESVGRSGLDMDDPSRLLALVAGIIFALMGIIVGLGVIAPGPGAHLLNVEDADELREQRRPLWHGSVAMVLIGSAMLALALAAVGGGVGIISRGAAGTVLGICLVGVAAVSFVGRNDNDEFMRAVGTEASALATYATLFLFGIWAALAHLGGVDWIEPLGFLATLLLLQLAALMWVSTRRGLLRPR